jgi:hypothetical protein
MLASCPLMLFYDQQAVLNAALFPKAVLTLQAFDFRKG